MADIVIKRWHFIVYLLSLTWWHFGHSYLSQGYFRRWTDG